MQTEAIEPDWLFKVRVAVARHGEMDRAKWWNTNKALSTIGSMVFKRGFPRTAPFAQARAVFAVARHRCEEAFAPPKSVTLWALPDEIEEAVENAWEGWLNNAPSWSGFFDEISKATDDSVGSLLSRLGLVRDEEVRAAQGLRRSSEGRSVPLSRLFGGSQGEIALLALGFDRGVPGNLVVPYARLA